MSIKTDNTNIKQKGKKLPVLIGISAAAILAVVLSVIWIVGQGDDDSTSVLNGETKTVIDDRSQQGTDKPKVEDSPAEGLVIITRDSDFGNILFNEGGQAIYIWEVEKSETPECYGSCAEAWPPVLTNGTPKASGDVRSDLLGTVVRSDGTTQVTYNGHPLYYYAHEGPGEVKCHNVSTHGGLWWVIQPDGNRVE